MRSTWISIITAGLAFGTMTSVAFASTTNSTLTGQKEVSINGSAISDPYARVVDNTTYMPIWYVGQALSHIQGVTQQWDGNHHVWQITLPANLLTYLPQLTKAIPIGSGNTTITINGTPVKVVDTFAATDPVSKKPTVYMPIYYIQQILSEVGIVNTWDGNDWNIVNLPTLLPGGNSPSNATGSLA